jgi:hypothetical protein
VKIAIQNAELLATRHILEINCRLHELITILSSPNPYFGVESSSSTSSIFHESFLLALGLAPENEEISAPPPCGFLIGIYLFYENWSTETFRKKESNRWAVPYTYLSANEASLRTEDFGGEDLAPFVIFRLALITNLDSLDVQPSTNCGNNKMVPGRSFES